MANQLRQLLLSNWEDEPNELPTKYEFTEYKVFYHYGEPHVGSPTYDNFYIGLAEKLSEPARDAMNIFNSRRDMTHDEKMDLLSDKICEEIEKKYCLWAYKDKQGQNQCDRDMKKILEYIKGNLTFVTDDCMKLNYTKLYV
ncbi:ORF127 protein [Operophtera brumata nucleopolyhedrovirus]|uniref:ORF127 protein n=1 Tax=Operophtera brumata nucleopolyhedrovirus TaxID=1046267 RepID=A0A2H4V019_9ABAC|nr:ORF127 protein [Operophtera brumata nucleopolyhedrovirus]AUA60358.1 ORF127 protein [Operophtera brumata nucleopolyhedrovirus]